MTRNAMWQVQKGREPLGLRRAVLFDVFPTVSTTNHRAHRNDEHIHQLVTAVGGIGASGIGQRGKIVLKRGRWEHTHKGPPLGTKGFWLQITRPPYRKTHSSFKCACPATPSWRRRTYSWQCPLPSRGASISCTPWGTTS